MKKKKSTFVIVNFEVWCVWDFWGKFLNMGKIGRRKSVDLELFVGSLL